MGKPAAAAEQLSKSALKNKKRKEAAKSKVQTEKEEALAAARTQFKPSKIENNTYQGAQGLLFDPDKEKKIRKLNDKIAKIEKIKQAQAEGKTVEKKPTRNVNEK